ncbi:hypothetical protein TAE01_04140 [Terrabacter aerolatus]|uniref:Uncharacterized protein n=1 Tax=Terrabacter aerolatus TaxID=422442 RepID=A0A512CWL6_9MICO|nr:hypothetical protein TAE01_04140 [Terrabacter aerolatus]
MGVVDVRQDRGPCRGDRRHRDRPGVDRDAVSPQHGGEGQHGHRTGQGMRPTEHFLPPFSRRQTLASPADTAAGTPTSDPDSGAPRQT